MEGNKQRIHYIDVLKGIGIVFVVFAHCNIIPYLHGYICSFHMALFFFISGMMMNMDKYKTYGSFLLSRIKQLYIPYVVFYLLLYAYWLLVERQMRWIAVSPLDGIIGLFWGSDNNHWIYPVGVMWFVIGLLSLEIVFYSVEHMQTYTNIYKHIQTYTNIYKHRWIRGCVLVLLTVLGLYLADNQLYILPFSLNNALLVIPFFAVGYSLRESLIEKNVLVKINKIYIIVFLVIAVAFTLLNYSYICDIGHQTDISGLRIPPIYLFYTVPFVEIALWLVVSILINKNSLIEWLGRNTLPILAFHPPISRAIIYVICMVVGITKNEVRESIPYSLSLTIMSILMCIPFVIIWNKVRPIIETHIMGKLIGIKTK